MPTLISVLTIFSIYLFIYFLKAFELKLFKKIHFQNSLNADSFGVLLCSFCSTPLCICFFPIGSHHLILYKQSASVTLLMGHYKNGFCGFVELSGTVTESNESHGN